MKRGIAGLATALLMSGGWVLAGVGAGIAEADSWCSPVWCNPNPPAGCSEYAGCWCPGQSLPKSGAPIDWDMGVCHNYHYSLMGGPGQLIPPPAGFCPPAPFSDNLYDPC
jgi:hypothetical protein